MNYTFSKSIDNASVDGNGFTAPVDNYNFVNNRGRSDTDPPHAFNFSGSYTLPFGKGQRYASSANGFVNRLIGDWTIGLLAIAQSGTVFSVTIARRTLGSTLNTYANYSGDRTLGTVVKDGRGVQFFSPEDVARFTFPGAGEIGNSGRNAFRCPGFVNMDLNILKPIPITERVRMQFRVEMYNTWNHANFTTPGTSILPPTTFGRLSATANTSSGTGARVMQMALLSAASKSQFQIGVTDWNLNLAGQPAAMDLATSVGFAGIEISLGRKPVDGKLPLDNPELQSIYLQKSKELNCKLISTCLDIFHVNGLKNDKLAEKWLSDAIGINRKLGVRNILLPFFGQRALETTAELDYVADILRNFAPQAQKAGVTLGIENTNSAIDNLRILDRARSEAVKVFYDIGNSFPRGYDIYHEIRFLGRDRICQFHLKDNPGYLGEGGINFPKIFEAIDATGFQGYADLETSSPAKNIPSDMAKNLAFLKSLRVSA